MSIWVAIDMVLILLIVWWTYQLLKKEFLINKLGAKASFVWLVGIVIVSSLIIFITFPLAKNTYEIKQYIKGTELSKYIDSYELEGFMDSIVIAKGNEKFKELDNKTKFEYMDSIQSHISSIASSNVGIGDGGYNEVHEMIGDMKVEVNVNGDNYVCKNNKLILNGGVIYGNILSLNYGGYGEGNGFSFSDNNDYRDEKNDGWVNIFLNITATNVSNDAFIKDIKFKLVFPDNAKIDTIKSGKLEFLGETKDYNLAPEEIGEYEYNILFKKDEFTKEEIEEIVKDIKFKVTYTKVYENNTEEDYTYWQP